MGRPEKRYDVIVVGGGIHGLACAAYLQKAGLKTVVFERRMEPGAHCGYVEIFDPYAKINLTAALLGALNTPAHDDLELDRFGLEMLASSEWGYFHPFKDKTAVLWHMWDMKKQFEAWQTISRKDADTLQKLVNYFGPLREELTRLANFTLPSEEVYARQAELIHGCPLLPKDWMEMNAMEVTDALFEDIRIRTAISGFVIMAGFHPWEKGISAAVPLTMSGSPFSFAFTARGGSYAYTLALLKCFEHHGGVFYPNCPVEKIITENGEARGVVLSEDSQFPGEEVRSEKAVVSNLSCYPTFNDLVGLDNLSEKAAQGVKNYSYNDAICFGVYWVLKEPLRWEGYPSAIQRAFGFNYGVEDAQDIKRFQEDFEASRISDPPVVAIGSIQGFSLADPSQAPGGHHTVTSWANAVYEPEGQGSGAEKWDEIAESYGDKVEGLLSEYAPNIKTAKIERYCETPIGFYRRNPSAIMGSAISGAVTPEQAGPNCPFPECGAPRTPIHRLYICNSMWPFNTSNLSGGYKAALAVAEDWGVREKDWWRSTPFQAMEKWLEHRKIQPRYAI